MQRASFIKLRSDRPEDLAFARLVDQHVTGTMTGQDQTALSDHMGFASGQRIAFSATGATSAAALTSQRLGSDS